MQGESMGTKTLIAQFLVPSYGSVSLPYGLGNVYNHYDTTMTVSLEVDEPKLNLDDVRNYVPKGWHPEGIEVEDDDE